MGNCFSSGKSVFLPFHPCGAGFFPLKCCEWCFDLTWKWSIPPFSPSLLSFTYIVTETHPSHLKSTVSGLSQFISLPPLCLPFCFSSPCIPTSILFLPSPFPSGPVTILVFPKSSAIRHLQWINYTVLSQLDWASNIYSPPPQTQLLPAHLHPLMGLQSFFLSLLSSCFHAPILPSSFSSFPEFQLYPPVLSLPLDKQWRSSPLNTGISVKEEENRDRFG